MPNSKRRNGFSWRPIASSDGHVLAKLLHKFFVVSMHPRALVFTNLSYRLLEKKKGLAISWSLAISAEISHVPQDVEISPVPQEDPSETHPLEQLEISLPKRGEVEVKEQEKHAMLNEMQKIFVSRATNVCLHNYYECAETITTKLSEKEVSHFTSSRSSDRFVHGWLVDKSISFCKTTGLYWLVYEEGQGMYCFLCRKHGFWWSCSHGGWTIRCSCSS